MFKYNKQNALITGIKSKSVSGNLFLCILSKCITSPTKRQDVIFSFIFCYLEICFVFLFNAWWSCAQ